MKQPKTPLQPGETVLAAWFANQTQHAQRAVGGHLFLTDGRLLFEPHAFDAALAGRTWMVPLGQIAEVGKSPMDLSQFFGGGLRSRLKVSLRDGSEWFFVVNGMKAKIAAINAARDAARH